MTPLLAVVLLSLCGRVSAQEPVEDPTWQQYMYLLRASTLEWRRTEPFLLKLDYQLYDLAGKPLAQGEAEQSWGLANDLVKVHSSTLDEQDPQSEDAIHKTHVRESYLIHQVLHAVARPFPYVTKRADFMMDQFKQTIGTSEMDCFALSAPSRRTSDTAVYCTDADNHLAAMTGQGSFVLTRSNFRKYRNHDIPMDVSLSYGGKLAITAHVSELDALPAPANSDARAQPAKPDATAIAAQVMAGNIISKKTPDYPKLARVRHVAGTVVLWAIITKEGTVTALDVIASPDQQLSESSLKAVQKWKYKPYLLNGEPTEVDTVISVNYNLGR